MRFAYADPPYPGQSLKHYGNHPDYAGEVDHAALVERMCDEYDGWILHTSSSGLKGVLAICPDEVRLLAWTKPFASWKKGVYPAYAWEPVIQWRGRNDFGGRMTPRDYCAVGITLQRGLSGAKPQDVCFWLFDCLGVLEGDEMDDLFPGSGAVGRAWDAYRAQPSLAFPVRDKTMPLFAGEEGSK